MTGDERLQGCALLCVWTLGCYSGFEEAEASCRTPISAGDIRITEILANPQGADGEQEYIELFNASSAELDMSGSVVVTSRQDGSGERGHTIDALRLSPGDYVVLGNAAADALGPVDYSYGSALGNLRNSDARIALRCGATIVDEARYTSTAEGYALELDGGLDLRRRDGDAAARWCLSRDEGDERVDGNYGTPGAENRTCPISLEPGTCIEEGEVRDIVAPTAGELRISEWMANPTSVSDSDGEWLEVMATADVDLNGLVLSDGSSAELLVDQEDCLALEAGTSLLFVRNPHESENGGSGDGELTFSFSLNNEGETIRLSIDGEQIDLVSYETSIPGASTQLDIHGKVCTSWLPYGEGDLGSPGEPNPVCP